MLATIGSWSVRPQVRGLQIFRYEETNAALTYIKTLREEVSVAAQLLDPARGLLYIADDALVRGENPSCGHVLTYACDGAELRELSVLEPPMPKPTDIALTEGYALVAHYGSRDKLTDPATGAVLPDDAGLALYRLNPDGTPGALLDILKTDGGAERRSNLRCLRKAPAGDLFLVLDKGAARLYAVRLEGEMLALVNTLELEKGHQPRSAAFLPDGRTFVACDESNTDLSVYSFDPDTGAMTLLRTLTLCPQTDKLVHTSDMLLTADGTRLYVSVRTANRIYLLDVSPAGELVMRADFDCCGDNSRGLALSPDGRFLLSANVDGGTVTAFRTAEDGSLTPTGAPVQAVLPSNITFLASSGNGAL